MMATTRPHRDKFSVHLLLVTKRSKPKCLTSTPPHLSRRRICTSESRLLTNTLLGQMLRPRGLLQCREWVQLRLSICNSLVLLPTCTTLNSSRALEWAQVPVVHLNAARQMLITKGNVNTIFHTEISLMASLCLRPMRPSQPSLKSGGRWTMEEDLQIDRHFRHSNDFMETVQHQEEDPQHSNDLILSGIKQRRQYGLIQVKNALGVHHLRIKAYRNLQLRPLVSPSLNSDLHQINPRETAIQTLCPIIQCQYVPAMYSQDKYNQASRRQCEITMVLLPSLLRHTSVSPLLTSLHKLSRMLSSIASAKPSMHLLIVRSRL